MNESWPSARTRNREARDDPGLFHFRFAICEWRGVRQIEHLARMASAVENYMSAVPADAGNPSSHSGLFVVTVSPAFVLHLWGLRNADIMENANSRRVDSAVSLLEMLRSELTIEGVARVRILRSGRRFTLTLKTDRE